jgi:hypothetical protein
MIFAWGEPSPKTVCVAFRQRSQALQFRDTLSRALSDALRGIGGNGGLGGAFFIYGASECSVICRGNNAGECMLRRGGNPYMLCLTQKRKNHQSRPVAQAVTHNYINGGPEGKRRVKDSMRSQGEAA